MPIASISAAVAAPTAAPSAAARSRDARASRTSGRSTLESSRPGSVTRRSNTTAPAYTGPARQPRPTSSTPAIRACPRARASSSMAKSPSTRSRSLARSHAFRLPPDPIVPRFLRPELRTGTAIPGSVVALLRDAGGLAAAIPKVVQLRASHLAVALDLDLLEHGRVHREGALHADTLRDLAHRERLTCTAAPARDDEAVEHLDAFFLAFLHFHVDLHRIAGSERGNVRAKSGLLGHQQLVRHRGTSKTVVTGGIRRGHADRRSEDRSPVKRDSKGNAAWRQAAPG